MSKTLAIPNGWQYLKSKEIFDNISDRAHNGQLQVLSATQDRGIVPRAEMDIDIKFDENALPNYKRVMPGNFVIHLRSFQGGLAYSEVEGIISPAYTILKPKVKISDEYYKAFFQSVDFIKQLNSAVYGIRDGKQISYGTFGELKIPFPPFNEQQAIAEILMAAEKAITAKERLIAAKQKQKKCLMQQLLTGKVRLLDYNHAWNKLRLGAVFSERTETNCSSQELLSVTGSSGIIPRTEIDRKNNSSDDKSKYLKVCKGDIAYNTMRMWQGVSAVSSYDGIVSPAYTVLIPSSTICAKYFAQLFKLPCMIFQFYRNSVGIVDDTRCLKYKNFAKIVVSVPSYIEQQAIAEILTTADREIELLQKDLEQQKLYKKYLMQQLLTGKIRVKGEMK